MNFKIKIPLIQTEPDDNFKTDLIKSSPVMINKYGAYFRLAAALTNLPVQVLYSMGMVESTGQHYKANGSVIVTGAEQSTGIMQISPNMFYEVYMKEVRGGRISPELMAKVSSYLPIDFKSKSTPQPATAALKAQVLKALQDPQFNILASAIVLRRLLEESANADMTMRLDKAIVKYNAGLYVAAAKTTEYQTGDTAAVIKVAPAITKGYIVKVVGRNGAMYYFLLNKIS